MLPEQLRRATEDQEAASRFVSAEIAPQRQEAGINGRWEQETQSSTSRAGKGCTSGGRAHRHEHHEREGGDGADHGADSIRSDAWR